MSQIKRHYGVISNMGTRCIVVFRQLPDDKDKCLIIQPDSLPEVYRHAVDELVKNEGQKSCDLFEVMDNVGRMSTGENMLTALHNSRLLQPIECNKIKMRVTPETLMRLDELNAQIDELNIDQSKSIDKLAPHEDVSDELDKKQTSGIANKLIEEANELITAADEKLERAYKLEPTLKPVDPVETIEPSASTFTIDTSELTQTKAIQLLKTHMKRPK